MNYSIEPANYDIGMTNNYAAMLKASHEITRRDDETVCESWAAHSN